MDTSIQLKKRWYGRAKRIAMAQHIWKMHMPHGRALKWCQKVAEDSHERPLFGKLRFRRVIFLG